MRNLRWLALAPFALAVIFLVVAVLWTEIGPFLVSAALVGVAAIVWRVFAGRWPSLESRQ
jgi:hypothetical protein